ncbi:MAG: hypothetical protein AAB388_02405 [Patescibacteria group bacterium]
MKKYRLALLLNVVALVVAVFTFTARTEAPSWAYKGQALAQPNGMQEMTTLGFTCVLIAVVLSLAGLVSFFLDERRASDDG